MWITYQCTAIFFWAAMNVVDSLLVRHYQKNPFVLGWFLSGISLVMLFMMAVFVDIRTPWMWWILFAGITGWIGDLVFYRTIRELDVSVANIGWSIMAIVMGIAGFFLWTEHRAHLFSFLPFLLLLACPIMHLFHHGGHGGHRHDGEQEDNRAQHSGCGSHHRNPETALAQTQPSIETKGTLS